MAANNVPSSMIHQNGCWMCGKPADSREHRYKKSELKKIFPPKPKNKPYHANDLPLSFSFDSGLVYKINSPDSATQKYPPLICKDCNTANTQNLDRAYDKFSDWCWNNSDGTFIDLNSIWGATYYPSLFKKVEG